MGFSSRSRVVIIGAGFAGLSAARTLAESSFLTPEETHSEVLLIDRNNYHTFSPLLYRVGTAELDPHEVAFPIRPLVRRIPNVDLVVGEVDKVDLEAHQIKTNDTIIPYDYILFALGSTGQVASVPGAAECAYPLHTLEQGIALRNQILRCLERALHETDHTKLRHLLTFIVVGGGISGVEFSSALADFIQRVVARQFPGLESQTRIMLFDTGGEVLAELPEPLRAYALARLRSQHVQVLLRTRVAEITPQVVYLKGGMLLPAGTVIWAGGVRGNPAAQKWGLATTRNGQVSVLPTLQLPDYPEVYVAGDLAEVQERARPLPLTATVAVQQGRQVAQNIRRQIERSSPLPFRYRSPSLFATLGRHAAVAQCGERLSTGFSGWTLWATRHIWKLVTATRMGSMLHWTSRHLSRDTGMRLILPNEPEVGFERLELFDGWQTRQGSQD